MANVTYLLGAGASAPTLPCIKEIPERLDEFHTFMHGMLSGLNETHVRKFLSECENLKKQVKQHNSIDTYAKKLFITDSNKYQLVKALTTCFLTYEQLRFPAEQRYDAFIAALIGRNRRMPANVKVLSWNYDFQFEKAFSQYTQNDDLYYNQGELQVVSNKNLIEYGEGFALFKINGTTEFVNQYNAQLHNDLYEDLNEFNDITVANKLLYNYLMTTQEQRQLNGLSFSWEESYNSKTLEMAVNAIKETDSLVVIGYSFPFFNRIVDRALFNAMPNLSAVYIQDKNPENVIDSFTSVAGKAASLTPVPVHRIDAFYLPAEL